MYEEADGVSIGASLAPVLANTIILECEKVIVNRQIERKEKWLISISDMMMPLELRH